MFEIKQVTTQLEADRLRDFYLSHEAFDLDFFEEVDYIKELFAGILNNESERYWYVEDKGKIVGGVGIQDWYNKIGNYILTYFAVHKDYRNRGLGSLLYKVAEDFARSKNCRILTLETGSGELYASAREFYEKHGFIKSGVVPKFYKDGLDKVDYYKVLNPVKS